VGNGSPGFQLFRRGGAPRLGQDQVGDDIAGAHQRTNQGKRGLLLAGVAPRNTRDGLLAVGVGHMKQRTELFAPADEGAARAHLRLLQQKIELSHGRRP
jgi:hypothetical protein